MQCSLGCLAAPGSCGSLHGLFFGEPRGFVHDIAFATGREVSGAVKRANEFLANVVGVVAQVLAQPGEGKRQLHRLQRNRLAAAPWPEVVDLAIDRQYIKNEAISKLNFIENRVVQLIAQQKTTKQISELLFLSEKTVEAHRSSIIQKLGLPHEKNALMKWAINFE